MSNKLVLPFGTQELVVETGKVAKQADGAVTVQVGDTVVLVAVVCSREPVEDIDYFPLMVDYRERFYAAGRIPGSFYRREGRPQEGEVLKARLVDRAIRPLFPEDFRYEVQIYVSVLSMDQENLPDVLGIVGASIALNISPVPFRTQVAGVKVGINYGKPVLNPTVEQLEKSSLNLVVAGTKNGIIMIEGHAKDIEERYVLEAIKVAQEEIKTLTARMEEFCRPFEKEKLPVSTREIPESLIQAVTDAGEPIIDDLLTIGDKQLREKKAREGLESILINLLEAYPEQEAEITHIFNELFKRKMRRKVLDERRRVDGRGLDEIRPIHCEVGVLPRTHGSAIFTRGQTQALATVTLGTPEDEQMIDDLLGISNKRFMLHYNFPAYSVGEVRPVRGPGRREIGHGALAEKSLEALIPRKEDFPYTIRVVSEILESNGSSSMATVCAGCLSLMDAGVPIRAPAAGIAIGLIKEADESALLTDIIGLEDHFGDMDLKIAGTRNGVTSVQMDLKIEGIEFDLLEEAFQRAKSARQIVLEKMLTVLEKPRAELSPYAPRIKVLKIDRDKIGELIGPAGKVIKNIIEKTGVKIDVDDDGTVYVASTDSKSSERAIKMILDITADVEINKVYVGKVVKVTSFGALVEILPGKVGLVHISELDNRRIARVEDVCREGDTIMVKVIDFDPETGKIRLSRRAALGVKERRFK
ncbi:polyribonucleotide nucleotidyltransferase [Candidatus Sumerlaeota bacterium]|nr:polyribonucleotide nucleotidyltransferase [Candidatus Sumerlaeota bacterium]